MLKVTKDHSLFSYYFYILSFYPLVLFTTNIIFSFIFSVPPHPSLSSILTQLRLVRLELEMQFSVYHRYWGCRITMVDCMKDFLYIIAGSCAGEDIRSHGDGFRFS